MSGEVSGEEAKLHGWEFVNGPLPTCPHGDSVCPCPDGDACHYEGDDAWPCQFGSACAVDHGACDD